MIRPVLCPLLLVLAVVGVVVMVAQVQIMGQLGLQILAAVAVGVG